jgi:hypothetical protein
MIGLWEKLKAAKPTERTEEARRYAVTITEFEKVMGYFNTFIIEPTGEAEFTMAFFSNKE